MWKALLQRYSSSVACNACKGSSCMACLHSHATGNAASAQSEVHGQGHARVLLLHPVCQ